MHIGQSVSVEGFAQHAFVCFIYLFFVLFVPLLKKKSETPSIRTVQRDGISRAKYTIFLAIVNAIYLLHWLLLLLLVSHFHIVNSTSSRILLSRWLLVRWRANWSPANPTVLPNNHTENTSRRRVDVNRSGNGIFSLFLFFSISLSHLVTKQQQRMRIQLPYKHIPPLRARVKAPQGPSKAGEKNNARNASTLSQLP